jgi:hypothetical protein
MSQKHCLSGKTPRDLSSVQNAATLDKMTDIIHSVDEDVGMTYEEVVEEFKKIKDTWKFPGGFNLHLMYIWKLLIKYQIIQPVE